MSIYRASQNSSIGFLDLDSVDNKRLDTAEKIENYKNEDNKRCITEDQRARKLEHKFNPENLLAKGNSISSARCGEVTDTGGPSKQINVEGQNSIWQNKTEEIIDNGEKIREEKEEMNAFRKAQREERMSELVENIQKTDNRKNSQVSSAVVEGSGSGYKNSNGLFSIFDKEFNVDSKIPEKTAGEKAVEEAREARIKDTEEWKQGGKVTKVSDFGNLFN